MSRISVSVVIPCYNAEAYVRDAVLSALNQTYPIEQIICVDDGSTDNTLSILQELCREYPHRLTVRTGPNRGGNHARNIGLGLSASEYVQFLDADDILLEEKIEQQVGIAERYNQPDVVVGAYLKGPSISDSKVVVPGSYSDIVNLAGSRMGRTSSNLWKASCLRAIGGWGETVESSQEYDLLFRILKDKGSFLYDHRPLTFKRDVSHSITRRGSLTVPVKIVETRVNILKYAKKEKYPEYDIDSIKESLFYWIKHLRHTSLEEAIRWHKIADLRSFNPSSKKYGYIYTLIYRVVGFECAENIFDILRPVWNIIRSLRSHG